MIVFDKIHRCYCMHFIYRYDMSYVKFLSNILSYNTQMYMILTFYTKKVGTAVGSVV